MQNFSISVPHHPHGKEFFPNNQSKPTVNVKTFPPCSVIPGPCKISLHLSWWALQVLKGYN